MLKNAWNKQLQIMDTIGSLYERPWVLIMDTSKTNNSVYKWDISLSLKGYKFVFIFSPAVIGQNINNVCIMNKIEITICNAKSIQMSLWN